MGKLEKIGAAVVGVLLCIIVAVGILNKRQGPANDNLTEAERASERRKSDDKGLGGLSGRSRLGNERPGNKVRSLEELEAELRAREDPKRRQGLNPAKKGKATDLRKGKPKAGPAYAKKSPGETPAVVKNTPVRGVWPKTHVVQPDEVLGLICQRVYGTTRMIKAVLAANPGLNPRRMLPNKTKIILPAPIAGLAKNSLPPKSATTVANRNQRPSFISSRYLKNNQGKNTSTKTTSGDSYVVKKGDKLSTIAQRELGSIRHMNALLDANRHLIKDPNVLREGWKLMLPTVN